MLHTFPLGTFRARPGHPKAPKGVGLAAIGSGGGAIREVRSGILPGEHSEGKPQRLFTPFPFALARVAPAAAATESCKQAGATLLAGAVSLARQ
jgi:hypothetical protein